jgi:predicted TIM-barrel fold metal-dependent hydrolase
VWSGAVIDADVHINVPGLETLMPYLAPVWEQFIADRGWRGPANLAVTYPPGMPSTARPDWRPGDGRAPASDLSLLREHVLDPLDVEYAVATCYYAIDSLRHPDWAAGLASALNDWLVAEWLEKEPRLRASLVVPARSPSDAAREIERVGDHPGFVQVLMPVRTDRLYGNRMWHPVYEAMCRHGLAMGLHWGGTVEGPPGPTGWPSWYVEEYVAEQQVYTSQITNLIGEGVFQAYPELRVSVAEIGFAFLPGWMWRMDKDWKAVRREIPWLNRAPSEILRDHFRFCLAPIDAGPPAEMALIVDWLESEDLLMFATDYPHWHDDDVVSFLEPLPPEMVPKVMAESARTWYRL